MSVVFALTIQSALFRVEIYNSNSQKFHRPTGKLYLNLNNKHTCNALVCIDFCWRQLPSCLCMCVAVSVWVCVEGCETNLGCVDRLVCEYLTLMMYKAMMKHIS